MVFQSLRKFKSVRWDPLPTYHKRLLILSTFFSLSTLVGVEWYLWSFGSVPDALSIEFTPGTTTSYSTRQVAFGIRIALLIPWGWYVAYQIHVKPVWSAVREEYLDLRKTLPPFLATLRAVNTPTQFAKLFQFVLTTCLVVLVLRVGFIAGVYFSAFLVALSTTVCYLEFKAGYYPGTESEFYREVLQVVINFTKKTAPYIIGSGFSYGLGLLINENYRIRSQERTRMAEIEANKQLEQQRIEANKQLEQQRFESNERIRLAEFLAKQKEAAQQSAPPRKGGFFG